MNPLIKGARYNPRKTREHVRKQDPDLSEGVNVLGENAGACFRTADPSGVQSYLLSCEITGYKPRYQR